MALRKKYDAFLSYSREDEPLLRPVVQTLEAMGRSVFVDRQTIEPGDDWQTSLAKGIQRAKVVFVLWCCDSASSEWVQQEIRWAREHN